MLKLKPEFLKKNGKTEFVILSARDFSAIEDLIEDALDVKILEKARREDDGRPGISLEELKRRLRAKKKPAKAKA
jgi:PHD/YefM family antitoxin component YafN of YafNO toxin-antitoxin module